MSQPSKIKNVKNVKVGIIGTGGMAAMHADLFAEIKGCQVVAACDIDPARVEAFAARCKIPRVYTDTAAMLKDGGLDAVSVVTPDAHHASVSIQALKAGLHVLCEKPLAVNYPEARKMVAAAKKAGTINMVNLSYRNSAALQKAKELVADGKIGEIVHVEANYLQGWLPTKVWGDWRTTPAWLWRLSSKHGSKGVLGDVGVHILDFASFPVGSVKAIQARLKAFPKAPGNRIGEYVLDANDSATMMVEFANGALGTIHTTRWAAGQKNSLFLRLCGTEGSILIDLDQSWDRLKLCSGKGLLKGDWVEVKCPATPNNHHRFIRSIQTGVQDQPDFARGAEVQKLLDACFVAEKSRSMVRI